MLRLKHKCEAKVFKDVSLQIRRHLCNRSKDKDKEICHVIFRYYSISSSHSKKHTNAGILILGMEISKHVTNKKGCFRLGNPDFRFFNKTRNQKWILPQENLFVQKHEILSGFHALLWNPNSGIQNPNTGLPIESTQTKAYICVLWLNKSEFLKTRKLCTINILFFI